MDVPVKSTYVLDKAPEQVLENERGETTHSKHKVIITARHGSFELNGQVRPHEKVP